MRERRRNRAPVTHVTRTKAVARTPEPRPSHPLVKMQQRMGNNQTSRFIQALHDATALQRQEEEEMPEDELQAMHDAGLAQRADAPEEEELLQSSHDPGAPSIGLEGGAVGSGMADAINGQRGGGSSLESGLRVDMESAFNTSFEGVRVHRDATADSLARDMTARAFTTGNDIFLRQDVGAGDREVMAHELTHVVQQRSLSGDGEMTVRPAGDQYEQEADHVADSIVRGEGLENEERA